MGISKVIFADISSFTVGSTVIEGIQSCQISEPAEIRPVYTWGLSYPAVLVSVPVLGSGSISYVGSDGTGSDIDTDWKTLLDGDTNIVISAGYTKGNSSIPEGTATTVTLEKATYQGKSFSMNARNEGVVSINFAYQKGLNL